MLFRSFQADRAGRCPHRRSGAGGAGPPAQPRQAPLSPGVSWTDVDRAYSRLSQLPAKASPSTGGFPRQPRQPHSQRLRLASATAMAEPPAHAFTCRSTRSDSAQRDSDGVNARTRLAQGVDALKATRIRRQAPDRQKYEELLRMRGLPAPVLPGLPSC